MITNKEKNIIKKEIIKALTVDSKENVALFYKNSSSGEYDNVFHGITLKNYTDKIVMGLNIAQRKINGVDSK